ncbi:tripartite tricarboxylate transporter permease [Rhodovulum marinum]|uniref:TctA family transporter n=1 Tax=Rhodovulum marinum TaxID=320662 RepID=A0A4R2PV89_9RHOB|nr:tripartite tricarboxylate transporter permease [Rhodovulum marinum]TCP39983.1 TctA family transporter [Rhodovulum marinum]
MPDTITALGIGLQNVFSWPNVLIPVLGTVLAMTVSFLPGIGAASLAAVMVVLTLHWEPVQVLLLFGALTGGATFMGSVTAILFGIPGNAASSVTLLDGHPMAHAGRPRTALAAAATASALGSVFGVVVLILLLPAIRPLLLQIGPLERAALAVWGLATIIAVLNGRPLKAFAATGLGLLLAMVGSDPTTSQPRWTFGRFEISDGLAQGAMLLGFFTLSEVLSWRKCHDLKAVPRHAAPDDTTRGGVLGVLKERALVLRASLIGLLVGIIPGVGGTVAGFVAYGQTVQTARGDRSGFGKGDIRGVIGPEAAVDAKDGGSLLPVLALGVPGSEGGVFLLTVLAIHGFVPGSAMLGADLPFTFTLIFALLASNLLTSALGLALVPGLSRLTRLPIDRIALPVIVVGLVTVVQIDGLVSDLFVAVGFAALGYAFRRLDWPRVPFVIAFVLGPSLESNLALVCQLHAVDRLDLGSRPLAWVIIALTLLSVVWMVTRPRHGASEVQRASIADRGVTILLGCGVALFAGIALTGGRAYSGYALGVCFVTLGTFAALALAQAFAPSLAGGSGKERPFLPASHRLPLLLVAIAPGLTLLFGLPLACGGLVLFWMLPSLRQGNALRRLALVVAAALVTVVVVTLYLDRVAVLDLPAPIVPVLPA